jgi:ribonuclease G
MGAGARARTERLNALRKEIIVNADDLESRVAIIEDGQLAELHVEREPRMVGSIYKARVVSVLPGMDAAFADIGLEKNVFLCADDVGFVSRSGVTTGGLPRSASISQRLKEGQEVVVQIVRAPVGSKGARATTRLALPGRYLVLLLTDGRQVGVSRRIEDRKERERLRKIGERIRPKGMGLIMRTEAEGHGREELEADLKVLLDLSQRLTEKAASIRAPALMHQDLTLTYQVIRDVFSEDVDRLLIDSKSVYDNAVELVSRIAPKLTRRIKRYRGRLPIFDKYGIEGEIDRLLRRRVWLHAGGYISIDQAEAFTAIDVNTGRFTGSTDLADTILRTNLEAAEEIARQLRLRDVGGIIVIDFIDMERAKDRQRVMKAFDSALKRDRQKTKIVHLSPLGLIEMTRKRRGESLMETLMEACPRCGGLGRVRNALTVAAKIERETRRIAAERKVRAFVIRAAPQVAALLIGPGGERATHLEQAIGGQAYIRADARRDREDYDITPTTPAQARSFVKLYSEGDELTVEQLDPGEPTAGEAALAWADGYRVEVEGASPNLEGKPVVLISAGRSFGRARVKGAPPKAEPEVQEKKPRRRRGGRRRSHPKREPERVGVAQQVKAETAPQEAPGEPPLGEPSQVQEPAPDLVAATQAGSRQEEPERPGQEKAPEPTRRGLLLRGARRIARVRR